MNGGELQSFLDSLFLKSGYDFRNYSQASLERRVSLFKTKHKFRDFKQLQNAIFSEETLLTQFIDNMTVQVTEIFRDPSFHLAMRLKVLDLLKTYPRIKIWHAGCSNGAEVYSMAILLKEADLLDRVQIYATDINESSLKQAYGGVYALRDMRLYTENYQRSGGQNSFSDYYRADNASVIMDRELKKNITFSFHNLTTDWVFTEAHLILCRNVLIYFDKVLQNRVLNLFQQSLVRRGLLALGLKESLRFSDVADNFDCLDRDNKIYQKRC